MRKVLVVAENKTIADRIAKAHSLLPWQWRYVFGPESLMGAGSKDTVFVHADWVATREDTDRDRELQMNIALARHSGANIVIVDS